MITLPEDRSMPLYQALYLQLRQQIQSGALPYGKKLPSKRKLSEQLGISVNTVDSAYCQLEAEGFIQSSPRRGFFVFCELFITFYFCYLQARRGFAIICAEPLFERKTRNMRGMIPL